MFGNGPDRLGWQSSKWKCFVTGLNMGKVRSIPLSSAASERDNCVDHGVVSSGIILNNGNVMHSIYYPCFRNIPFTPFSDDILVIVAES